MTTRQDAEPSPWGLLWGVFWRSVLWYTVAGAVLGGMYGCAIIAVAMLSTDASEAIEPSEVWAMRAIVAFFGVTGFIAGWALARAIGREMRPLLGAVIGGMAGVQLGGFHYLFAYFYAFPFGTVLGGAYGLAVGFVNAILVAALTRALFFPLSEPRLYRRAVVWTSLLGVLILPGFWFVILIRSSGYTEVGGMTGTFWGDVFIYAGFPPLILALVAQWFGGRLATWYGIVAPRTPATTEVPALRWTLRREKPRRIAYAALALTVLVLLAAGFRLYQTRTILTCIPRREAILSRDGERAAVLAPGEFEVYSVPEGRRRHALPLGREEKLTIWTRPCGPPTAGSWRHQTAGAYTSTTRWRKRRSRSCPSRPPPNLPGARMDLCWPSRPWRERIIRLPPRARRAYGAGIAGVGPTPSPWEKCGPTPKIHPGLRCKRRHLRGDRDEKAWAFESAVEKALWWMLRSTLGRALRLMLRLWRGSKIFRITSYAGAGILVTAGIAFTSVRIYENRHASIHVGPGAYELSLRGDRFSIYTAKGIEVWNLDNRRRIGTVRDGDQTPDFMSPDDGCSPGECSTASIRSTPWRTSGYGVRKMVRLYG